MHSTDKDKSKQKRPTKYSSHISDIYMYNKQREEKHKRHKNSQSVNLCQKMAMAKGWLTLKAKRYSSA